MRKGIALLFCLALTGFGTASALADTAASATASVHALVNPNISMSATTAIVDAGTIQTGDFNAQVQFRVDANQEQLTLGCEATALYKGDDPTNTAVAPIPIDLARGCLIAPANANPLAGASNVAQFSGTPGAGIGAFPSFVTNAITFESSQAGVFSQPVFMTVWWNQNDPEKPTGEYSGKVKLLALINPA